MKKIYVSILIAVSIAFVFSLVAWIVNYPGRRYVMVFQSRDTGELIAEQRFLPRKSIQGNEMLFVDELLLGPMTERCKLLFSPGTDTISAFVRDGIFYVNISERALDEFDGAVNIKEGAELLSRNILWNFSAVNSVEFFIDSKQAY